MSRFPDTLTVHYTVLGRLSTILRTPAMYLLMYCVLRSPAFGTPALDSTSASPPGHGRNG